MNHIVYYLNPGRLWVRNLCQPLAHPPRSIVRIGSFGAIRYDDGLSAYDMTTDYQAKHIYLKMRAEQNSKFIRYRSVKAPNSAVRAARVCRQFLLTYSRNFVLSNVYIFILITQLPITWITVGYNSDLKLNIFDSLINACSQSSIHL